MRSDGSQRRGVDDVGAVVGRIGADAARAPRAGDGAPPMGPDEAGAVAGRPPSTDYRQAFAVHSGRLLTVRDSEGGKRTVKATMDAGAVAAALPEARERIGALDALLAPAPYGHVRGWVVTLASLTEIDHEKRRTKGAVDALVDVTAMAFGLPAFCFTVGTMHEVIERWREKDGRTWFPSYSAISAVLNPHRDRVAADLRRTRAFLAWLEGRERAAKALPAPAGEPVRTEAEVEAWLIDREVEDSDDVQRTHARQYLGKLRRDAPELAERFRGRLEALIRPAPAAPKAAAPAAEGIDPAEVERAVAQLEAMAPAAARTAVARSLRREVRGAGVELPARLEDRLHRLAEPTADAVRAANPLVARAMAAAGAVVAERVG